MDNRSIDIEKIDIQENEYIKDIAEEISMLEKSCIQKENIDKSDIKSNKKNLLAISSMFCALSTASGALIVSNNNKEEDNNQISVINNNARSLPIQENKSVFDSSLRLTFKEVEINKDLLKTATKTIVYKNKETSSNIASMSNNPDLYLSYNLEELNEQNTNKSMFSSKNIINNMSSNNIQNANRYWEYFEYHGNAYGVDPYLLMAISCQESRGDHYSVIPGGKHYNGAGYGIMQIEKPGIVTKYVSAYNHSLGQYETVYINSEEDVYDISNNIKVGAMILASRAQYQEYNPLVTLQGYNYGASGIRYALSYYLADGDIERTNDIYGKSGKTGELISYIQSNNSEWVDTVTSSGFTAREWYSREGWRKFGAGGGDKSYIERVLKYYTGTGQPYIAKPNGERVYF